MSSILDERKRWFDKLTNRRKRKRNIFSAHSVYSEKVLKGRHKSG